MTWVNAANAALLTDMYQLTMAASYHSNGMGDAEATFDLFVRELPPHRSFLVACGLEQALEFLESMRFDDDSIAYLRTLQLFPEGFLSFLADLRFTGEVRAIPEGEVAFESEPLLTVTAPLVEAQLVETFLLNCIGYQTMVASKAARVRLACGPRGFMDFSLRRDHGTDAGMKAARAAYVAGATGTSNLLAGKSYGIPVAGTMAHSYVMAFEDEVEAFRAYVRDFGPRSILLIDTFDVEQGARRAAQVAKELLGDEETIRGVRIDSGELAPLTRAVRKILDEAGLEDVQIVLSGDLDEYRIKELVDDGVPVDSFGVGTQLGTSGDAPALGTVYKLVHDERGPKMKLSAGKATLPGRKQIYRFDEGSTYSHDLIALDEEEPPPGRPLLEVAMRDGRRVRPAPSLAQLRERCSSSLAGLPARLRSIDTSLERYEVRRSERLQRLVEEMRSEAW